MAGSFTAIQPVFDTHIVTGPHALNASFSKFDVSIQTGLNILSADFPLFSFEGEVRNDRIDIAFPLAEVSMYSTAGALAFLNVDFKPFETSFLAGSTVLSASAVKVTAEGLCYQIPSINVSVDALTVSASGTLTGTLTIVSPDDEYASDDTGSALFTGDTYIVVNLHTKSHTTYRDGNNNAIAQTGELTFSSLKDKNVSDAYFLSRAVDSLSFVVKNNEETEREYEVNYKIGGQANLKNKKIPLAKGLKGTNWQFSIVSPEEGHVEVRQVDLIVNELKRRV